MKRRGSSTRSAETETETPVGPGPLDAIRRDKVERARALVRDPNYPPKHVTRAVAELLAKELKAGTDP